jgi:beta-lactamase regulating signal transducer with metallopeptidase domain/Tfp pilus assembly protein PilF
MRFLLDSAIRFGFDLALKATVVFLLTGAVLLLMRRSSAATRHRVGTFGLAAALLLPLLSAALPQVTVPILPDVRPAAPRRAASTPAVERARTAAVPASPEISWRQLALAVPEKTVLAPEQDTLTPASAPVVPPAPTPVRKSKPAPWLELGLALWTVGALAVGARLFVGWSRVRRIGREARPIHDLEWIEERDAAARRLALSRNVEIVESAAVPVAMTSGLLRPLLLIGRAARQWAVERRRVVLLHELAHVKRSDWPALIVAELALAAYWFHPLAWWLNRRVRRDAETACDDLVIASGTKPSVYAGHLLGIFRSLGSPAHPTPALAIVRPHHFEERLRTILDPRATHGGESRGQALLAAVVLAGAAAAVGFVSPWAPSCPGRTTRTMTASTSSTSFSSSSRQSTSTHTSSSTAKKPCNQKTGRLMPVVATAPTADPRPAPDADAAPEAPEAEPESGQAVPAIWTPSPSQPAAAPEGFVQASKHKSWKKSKDGSDWYSRGMDLHHDEDYEGAIEAFQKAIAEGYNEDAASYNIACGYSLLGKPDQAFEWLKKAMDEGFDVGAYLGDDDLDNLHSDPRWPQLKKEAREAEGSRSKNEARAVAVRYQRIVAKNAKSGEPFFDIGLELLRSDQYDLGVQAYQAAIDRGYRVGTAYYNQACGYAMAGDKDRAFASLQKALESGFDQPDTLAHDDDLDNLHGDPRFAEIKKQARELELPSYNRGWWRAGSRSERARWREAAERFEAYTQKHPESGRGWYNLGFSQLAGDRPEASIDAFQKALGLGYRKPETMYNIACGYARLDQKDPAFEWLYKALDAGFDAAGTLRGDDDLDNLRGDPRYRKAVEIARSNQSRLDD